MDETMKQGADQIRKRDVRVSEEFEDCWVLCDAFSELPLVQFLSMIIILWRVSMRV